jgi:hypothetical protein
MSQYETDSRQVSGGAAGGLTFAATMMFMIGTFQAIAGLAAIFDDQFFVVTQNYTFDLDVTAWGWIHLILGILLIVTGWALFSGMLWAAMTAVVLALLSAIENFFFIPYYPFWAILVIALDVWVIWALTRPGVVRS